MSFKSSSIEGASVVISQFHVHYIGLYYVVWCVLCGECKPHTKVYRGSLCLSIGGQWTFEDDIALQRNMRCSLPCGSLENVCCIQSVNICYK